MSIPLWAVAIVMLTHYWPLTFAAALVSVLIGIFGPNYLVWRVLWFVLAFLLVAAVLFGFSVS